MTEKSKPRPPWLREVIDNPNFDDKLETEAKALVDKLIEEYTLCLQGISIIGGYFAQCVWVSKWPENDKVVERAVEIFKRKNWSAEPTEDNCAGGRAGTFWLQPPSNWKPSANS